MKLGGSPLIISSQQITFILQNHQKFAKKRHKYLENEKLNNEKYSNSRTL
jgi:hypothetical protein